MTNPLQRKSVFEAAYNNNLPVLLKLLTVSGETRFVEYMASRLKRPIICTTSCHDDLTAADLIGRFLITSGEVVWQCRYRSSCLISTAN